MIARHFLSPRFAWGPFGVGNGWMEGQVPELPEWSVGWSQETALALWGDDMSVTSQWPGRNNTTTLVCRCRSLRSHSVRFAPSQILHSDAGRFQRIRSDSLSENPLLQIDIYRRINGCDSVFWQARQYCISACLQKLRLHSGKSIIPIYPTSPGSPRSAAIRLLQTKAMLSTPRVCFPSEESLPLWCATR